MAAPGIPTHISLLPRLPKGRICPRSLAALGSYKGISTDIHGNGKISRHVWYSMYYLFQSDLIIYKIRYIISCNIVLKVWEEKSKCKNILSLISPEIRIGYLNTLDILPSLWHVFRSATGPWIHPNKAGAGGSSMQEPPFCDPQHLLDQFKERNLSLDSKAGLAKPVVEIPLIQKLCAHITYRIQVCTNWQFTQMSSWMYDVMHIRFIGINLPWNEIPPELWCIY